MNGRPSPPENEEEPSLERTFLSHAFLHSPQCHGNEFITRKLRPKSVMPLQLESQLQ